MTTFPPAEPMRWPTEPPLNFRKLAQRSRWLIEQLELGVEWPEHCVAWPWATEDRRHTCYFQGKASPVTHVVLHFHEGPRPSKQHQGLHSCDISWCINARHLRWGTELQNRLDQVARERGDIGKIGLGTAYKVREELKVISQKYGVPMDAISRIASGKTWTEDKWETS